MSIKLYKQHNDFLDKQLLNVFHFLSIYHHKSILIGSSGIRNFLYTNDYDLNENFDANNTPEVIKKLHLEFINIFKKAKLSNDIYILDFKCGITNDNEPIRWSYNDLIKGFQTVNNIKYLFTNCLLQDSTIKIDICYLLNNIFQDITNNYFIEFTKKSKNSNISQINQTIKTLKEEMKLFIKDKNYIKALKRLFSIQKLTHNLNPNLLHILNSFIGRFYKGIVNLKLIITMLEQTFKPISLEIIYINIENVKQFLSYIVEVNIDSFLYELNDLTKIKSQSILIKKLNIIAEKMFNKLNTYIINNYSDLFKKL